MKYQAYQAWVRNRKHGTRTLVYEGGSLAKAIEMLRAGGMVIMEFKITATTVVYDAKGSVAYELDYVDGSGMCAGYIGDQTVRADDRAAFWDARARVTKEGLR